MILGSAYSSTIAPPGSGDNITEDNFIKGIYTKTGMKVEFDDENLAILVQTSDEQLISLNENESTVEIKDINGNVITMDDSGMTINCSGDLTIEASGKVVIKGSEVDVQ